MQHSNENDISRLKLTAVIGKTRIPVVSWQQVSDAYVQAIEALNIGASQTPSCLIVGPDGRTVAHVAYNGKVFAGHPGEWRYGMQPICYPSPSPLCTA